MKKFLTIFILLVFGVSCQEVIENPVDNIEDKVENNGDNIIKGNICGTWVYDHPEEGVTETMTFTETGVFYFSNTVTGVYNFENENVMGRYSRTENNLSISYEMNDRLMTVDYTILELDDSKLTIKANKLGLTFTYQKLAGDHILDFGMKSKPDYTKLVSGTILSYKSHNSKIAQVDSETGIIAGVGAGRTYVDLVTEKGTVVLFVEVRVQYTDYSQYLGKTEAEIRKEFGNQVYQSNEKKISYMLENDVLLIFCFDSMPRVVNTVGIDYSASSSYDETLMTNYLSSKFTYSPDYSTDGVDVFMDVNLISLLDLSFLVNIIKGSSQVVYNAFSFAPFKDHSISLGWPKEEVYAVYGDENSPFYVLEKDNIIAYFLVENYATELWIFFENEKVNGVVVVLDSSLATYDVHAYLQKEYTYYPEYSTNDEYAYVSEDGTVVVFYTISNNSVTYMLPVQTKSCDLGALIDQVRYEKKLRNNSMK